MSKKNKGHNTSSVNSQYDSKKNTSDAVDVSTKSPNDVQASKGYNNCK